MEDQNQNPDTIKLVDNKEQPKPALSKGFKKGFLLIHFLGLLLYVLSLFIDNLSPLANLVGNIFVLAVFFGFPLYFAILFKWFGWTPPEQDSNSNDSSNNASVSDWTNNFSTGASQYGSPDY